MSHYICNWWAWAMNLSQSQVIQKLVERHRSCPTNYFDVVQLWSPRKSEPQGPVDDHARTVGLRSWSSRLNWRCHNTNEYEACYIVQFAVHGWKQLWNPIQTILGLCVIIFCFLVLSKDAIRLLEFCGLIRIDEMIWWGSMHRKAFTYTLVWQWTLGQTVARACYRSITLQVM